MIKKDSLRLLVIAAAASVIISAGAVSAYNTSYDASDNVFCIGDISLELNEPHWDETEAEKLMPGEVISKDPQVTNTGMNDAFVFVSVDIPRKEIYTYDAATGARNEKEDVELLKMNSSSGTGLKSGSSDAIRNHSIGHDWTEIVSMRDTSDPEFNRYIFVYGSADTCRILGAADNGEQGETTAPLFDSMTFCNAVEGQSLDRELSGVDIRMYGIQCNGFGGEEVCSPERIWKLLTAQEDDHGGI